MSMLTDHLISDDRFKINMKKPTLLFMESDRKIVRRSYQKYNTAQTSPNTTRYH